MCERTTNLDAFDLGNGTNQIRGERPEFFARENRVFQKSLRSIRKTRYASQIFGTRATIIFVTSAENDGIRVQRRFDKKCARSFRTMKFMGANGNQVGIELVNVLKRFFAEPLDSIRMKKDSALAANSPKFRDRLNSADFVVGRHQRNQSGVWPQSV